MSDSINKEKTLLAAEDEVLSTLNRDGTRHWIRPKLSGGQWYTLRRGLAYVLMAVFVLVPWVRIGGAPLLRLDLIHREFTFFGATFRPTETPLLMLLLLGIFFSVFLISALFGRVWCGWACPQTVYMEFLFRPLERWFEGTYQQQKAIDKAGGSLQRMLKNVVYLGLAVVLANTFVAYFVGTEQLAHWMTGSPFQHPTAFLVMAGVTAAMFFDFSWFREQTCLVVCPYGRFQSALLDRNSLIVGYDAKRGEPRGKLKKQGKALPVAARAEESPGDCIDCKACVITCPTGIDIRKGLQMECINCTQCIDACDAIMTRIGRPTGLIRYSSQNELEGQSTRILRPRVAIYSTLVLVLFTALGVLLSTRVPVRVTVLRGRTPFAVLADDRVQNMLQLKIDNYEPEAHDYALEVLEPAGAEVVQAESPLHVEPHALESTSVFILVPRDVFKGGSCAARLRVHDEAGFEEVVEYRLLGPRK